MPLTYHPTAPRGQNWSLKDADGREHRNLSGQVVEGLLVRRGLSVRQIKAQMADARLAAPAAV